MVQKYIVLSVYESISKNIHPIARIEINAMYSMVYKIANISKEYYFDTVPTLPLVVPYLKLKFINFHSH